MVNGELGGGLRAQASLSGTPASRQRSSEEIPSHVDAPNTLWRLWHCDVQLRHPPGPR